MSGVKQPSARPFAQPIAICLLGPTACGKTKLSLQLCQRLPCEIISVDSALVYKGMDIGTAKPPLSVRRDIPHHLIDILNPEESYSAGLFVSDAGRLIQSLCQQGRIPVLTGGTMFYFNALEHGIDTMPEVSAEIRAEIEQLELQHGLGFLYNRLKQLDTKSAARIHANDAQRIKRALEVYEAGKLALSDFQHGTGSTGTIRFLKFAIDTKERSVLHERVAQRFDEMLEKGFVQEVSRLMLRGDLNRHLPSMRAIGYAQVWSYLAGEYGFDEMRLQAIYATRQLVKRQLTWMRKMRDMNKYYADLQDTSTICDDIEKKTRNFLQDLPISF